MFVSFGQFRWVIEDAANVYSTGCRCFCHAIIICCAIVRYVRHLFEHLCVPEVEQFELIGILRLILCRQNDAAAEHSWTQPNMTDERLSNWSALVPSSRARPVHVHIKWIALSLFLYQKKLYRLRLFDSGLSSALSLERTRLKWTRKWDFAPWESHASAEKMTLSHFAIIAI